MMMIIQRKRTLFAFLWLSGAALGPIRTHGFVPPSARCGHLVQVFQPVSKPAPPASSPSTTTSTSKVRQPPLTSSSSSGTSITISSSTCLHLFKPTGNSLALASSLHKNPSFCLTAILLLSTFGITIEQRTVVGKALSAPLATMALALLMANIGLVPFQSPVYNMINQSLVPLAVPMLLYDSDLRRVLRDTGSLLVAFGVGAVATIVGTLVAYPILPMRSLGKDGWRVACALAARHIGGAINFVAVAETLSITGSAVSAAIAADNVVVALYFAMLFAIAEEGQDTEAMVDKNIGLARVQTESELEYSVESSTSSNDLGSSSSGITLSTTAMAISVASTLVTTGGILTKALLPKGTSALPLTSVLTVIGATLFPNFFGRIRAAGTAMGIILIQMFFAASGAAGSIRLVLQQAPSLFAFSALQIAIHFVVLITAGRSLFHLPSRELYLASNANVGGPTTAAAMANAKNWKRLVLPALLIGILGYASATAIALALGPILVRMPLFGK